MDTLTHTPAQDSDSSSFWRNFLTGQHFGNEDFVIKQQVFLLNSYALIAVVSFVVFGLMHILVYQNTGLGVMELCLGVLIFGNALNLRLTHNLVFSTRILIAAVLMALLVLTITGGIEMTGIFWLFLFPPAVIYLEGRQIGRLWILLLCSSLVLLLCGDLVDLVHLPYSFVEMRQLLASLAVESILIYVFEKDKEQFGLLAHQRLQELHKSQELLNAAQSVSSIGSWEWDITTNSVAWSDELYHIFGLTPRKASVTYRKFLDLIAPQDRRLIDQIIQHSIKTRVPFEFEARMMVFDAAPRWILGKGRVIADKADEVIRLVGTAQDITARKLAETKLEERTEELERLNKMMIGRELKMRELKEEIRQLRPK